MEHLFYKEYRSQKLSDGRELFSIMFKDKDNKEYIWAPKWDDFSLCFMVAYVTEAQNAGVVIKNTLEKLDKDIKPFFQAVELIQDIKPSDVFPKVLQEKLQKLIPGRAKPEEHESKKE